jgi:glycosyltransferase involved in cell wall biosynthesis
VTTLTVVIPATDRPTTLERALCAIRSAINPPEELIVVELPPDAGPAAARNQGAREARSDVLVFVDADVEVHPDAFRRIRDAFQDHSLVAVFGSYDDAPEGGGLVSDFRNLLHHHVHHGGAGAATTFWAGLGAVRRETFLGIGGFDEERFPSPSVEDIELGMRLHANGAQMRLDPAIQGKHLKEWKLGTMITTDLLQRGVPWLRLVFEHGSESSALNLGWKHRLGTGASLVLLLGLARRNARMSALMLALLILLDRPFYLLLARHGGPRLVAAGFPLYFVHRLTSAAAVPIALTGHFFRRRA